MGRWQETTSHRLQQLVPCQDLMLSSCKWDAVGDACGIAVFGNTQEHLPTSLTSSISHSLKPRRYSKHAEVAKGEAGVVLLHRCIAACRLAQVKQCI